MNLSNHRGLLEYMFKLWRIRPLRALLLARLPWFRFASNPTFARLYGYCGLPTLVLMWPVDLDWEWVSLWDPYQFPALRALWIVCQLTSKLSFTCLFFWLYAYEYHTVILAARISSETVGPYRRVYSSTRVCHAFPCSAQRINRGFNGRKKERGLRQRAQRAAPTTLNHHNTSTSTTTTQVMPQSKWKVLLLDPMLPEARGDQTHWFWY